MKSKFSSKTMAYIALFVAMEIVLEYVFLIVPELPQGGRISLSLLPIILASYLMGPVYGLLTGLIASLVQFVLGLASAQYGPWSALLDYILPTTIVGLSAAFKSFKIGKVDCHMGIVITMILKYLIHVLSGALLFATYAPKGMNPWVYSFAYNLPYNLGTLILTLVVFTLIYPRLKKVFRNPAA